MMRCAIFCATFTVGMMVLGAEVTNVRGVQRKDSNYVDVYYDLTGTGGLDYTVRFKLEGKQKSPTVVSVTGDVGEHIAPGKNKHIVWNAGRDFARQKDELRATVTADGDYLVVDLIDGTKSTLDAMPHGGWTDEYKTRKLVMRKIPAGSFMMQNAGLVTLTKPFYIGIFEVTQRQWELVDGTRPAFFNNPNVRDALPVDMVSYNMICGGYLGKLQGKTGLKFDLPSEAQWEYACRAGTITDYNNGKNFDGDRSFNVPDYPLSRLLQIYDEERRCFPNGGRSDVAAFQNSLKILLKAGSGVPNLWGLYDMHGSVCEWCRDCAAVTLEYGVDPVVLSGGTRRVLRGGSWFTATCSGESCTSSIRRGPQADVCWFDEYPALGFRLMCPVDSAEVTNGNITR